MLSQNILTFLAVCEKGSFNRAAPALFLTPSAVMQQMNALEEDLGVKLMERKKSGITLTQAGEFFYQESRRLSERTAAIREEVKLIAESEQSLVIGTSLLEKCRLLYDLWVLFSEEEPSVTINMVPIGADHLIPKGVDLLESINSGMPWMKEWDFFEICRVSFGFALGRRHRLCGKSRLSLKDLAGERVLCFESPDSPTLHSMFQDMKENKVQLEIHDAPKQSLLWSTAFEGKLLLAPLCWSDILAGMTLLPCDWDYQLPYGIFSRKNPQGTLERFLRFVKKTYGEGNSLDVLPVLL